MILIVAPERPAWLPFVLGREGVDATDVRMVHLGAAVRRGTTAWARGRADRRLAARFAVRRSVDRLAARRPGSALDAVYASSFAARRTFAAVTRPRGRPRCVLVEDLPDLRQLHDDLDRASAAHPEATFLRRYRADPSLVAWQLAERTLADELVVRGAWAADQRRGDGFAAERVSLLAGPPAPTPRRPVDPERPALLLAGLASARAGLFEALAVVDALPQATLIVRPGEGLEPPDALRRPRVRAGTPTEILRLEGVDVVLAPSWCEADLPQVTTAARLGVPVIATDRAAGAVDVTVAGAMVAPGDAAGLLAAVTATLSVAEEQRP